jgi:hypothetical protein
MHFPPPPMVESKKEWYHQKVLFKSFPMNGCVSRLRQYLNWGGGQFLCPARPLVTELS